MKETENVYRIYDKIASWFDENRSRALIEKHYLDFFTSFLKPNAAILDLGCGTGEPIFHFLIEKGYKVIGVDASRAMVAIAQKRFPESCFYICDMRDLTLNETFDAIIAWHSFFHLPPDDQRLMFKKFAQHMKPDGILMYTSGPKYTEVWSDNAGEQLYHASLDAEEYRNLLNENHFEILHHAINDPACAGATVWIAKYCP